MLDICEGNDGSYGKKKWYHVNPTYEYLFVCLSAFHLYLDPPLSTLGIDGRPAEGEVGGVDKCPQVKYNMFQEDNLLHLSEVLLMGMVEWRLQRTSPPNTRITNIETDLNFLVGLPADECFLNPANWGIYVFSESFLHPFARLSAESP